MLQVICYFVSCPSEMLSGILVPALAGDVSQLVEQHEANRTADKRIQEQFATDDRSLSSDVCERMLGAHSVGLAL
jgi:hypothetical protein